MKTINREDYPDLTQAEIKEQGDTHMMNAIGMAVAYSGLEKTNELARLLGAAESDHVLKTVQNIIQTWECMDIELDLTRDRVFTVQVRVYQHDPYVTGTATVQ